MRGKENGNRYNRIVKCFSFALDCVEAELIHVTSNQWKKSGIYECLHGRKDGGV